MTTWVLVVVGHLVIMGYKSEADCKTAAKAIWQTSAQCVPASEDARAMVAR